MTKRTAFAVGLLVTSLAVAVDAQPADPVDEARRHAEAGQNALAAQNFETALGEYNEAYRLFANPLLLVNVARALSGLGRNADAIATLRRVANEPSLETPFRDEVGAEIARLRTLVGEIRISVSIDGAEVRVRGTTVGTSPLTSSIVVDPGVVEIEARSPGYRPGRWQGEVRARSNVAISLVPDPIEQAVAPAPAEPVTPEPPRPVEPAPAARSSTLLWVTGIGAGALGAVSLTLGAILLASCTPGEECYEPSLNAVPYVADTLGVLALVSGGVFLVLLLTGDDTETAAATALTAPGTLRF